MRFYQIPIRCGGAGRIKASVCPAADPGRGLSAVGSPVEVRKTVVRRVNGLRKVGSSSFSRGISLGRRERY